MGVREMQKTIDYLYRLKQANDEMGNYEAFNLYKAIEELESLQNRKCENCKYYSTGKQPDGFKWHKCDYDFECKTCFNDYFEKAEQ